MSYLEDLQRENANYHKLLGDCRKKFALDAATAGKNGLARLFEQDEALELSTVFHIMFQHCGAVIFGNGEPRVSYRMGEFYDKWDWNAITMSSTARYMSALALGFSPIKKNGIVVGTPNAVSAPDKQCFQQNFDIVYQGGADANADGFCYDRLGVSPSCEVEAWATYTLAQNSFKKLALDIVMDEKIISFGDKYAFGNKDELAMDAGAIVQALCLDRLDATNLFLPPNDLVNVPQWKKDALSQVFLGHVDKNMQLILDICLIWNEMCTRTSVVSKIKSIELVDAQVMREKLSNLGHALCIGEMIDALIAGVPVSDLLA